MPKPIEAIKMFMLFLLRVIDCIRQAYFQFDVTSKRSGCSMTQQTRAVVKVA
jgi:hypothetical protein